MMKVALKFSFAALCATLVALPSGVSATRASLVDDVCTHNVYMCCWNQNDNGVQDNTDVCRVGDKKYPGNEEGKVHCHGFVWAEDSNYESFILPLYKFVRTFDHRDARGYYGRIPGAPQCECLEKMPIVTRADCTTYSAQGLVACEDNDLRTHYEGEMKRPGGKIDFNLVDDCDLDKGDNGDGGGGDKKDDGGKKKNDGGEAGDGGKKEDDDTNTTSDANSSGLDSSSNAGEKKGEDSDSDSDSDSEVDDKTNTMEGPVETKGDSEEDSGSTSLRGGGGTGGGDY